MDAIVLVGGQGTRLRPLTLTTPKPMLPVAGVPLLTHQLARLRAAGVDRVVLATSYRAEVFASHFGDGSTLGLELAYVTEREPLGTAGGIRNVVSHLRGGPQEPVVVLNGDVLSGHDLTAQLALHHREDAAVTLHLVEVADPRAFGCVVVEDGFRVREFLEKAEQPPTNLINAGCYVFRRQVIDEIPVGRPVSVERETFPALLGAKSAVLGYVETAYWLDLGTPAAFVRGSHDLVLGLAPSSALPGPAGPALVLVGAQTDASAVLTGGTTVGERAYVGAGALVDASVVLPDARVEEDARVIRSVVGRGAVVGARAVLEDAVVGDGATVGRDNELREGARVWPGVALPDLAVRFSSDV